MNCHQCGAPNRDGAAFCKRCGSPLGRAPVPPGQQPLRQPPPSAGSLCPACGRQLRSGAAFCQYCGASFRKAGSENKKDPWLGLRIALAALCLGMLVFGALTVPGKLRERLGGETPASQSGPAGQNNPAGQSGPAGQNNPTGQAAPEPADLAAGYAQIDAMLENGEPDAPEATAYVHDAYEWFCDDEGWVEVTENGGETP